MYQGGVLAQGGRCRQLDTSAASLGRPLVELVPPTGEEHTVELQVHQRSSLAGYGGIAPAHAALASATPAHAAHQHGEPASACGTPGTSCPSQCGLGRACTTPHGTPHGKLADGCSCAELSSLTPASAAIGRRNSVGATAS